MPDSAARDTAHDDFADLQNLLCAEQESTGESGPDHNDTVTYYVIRNRRRLGPYSPRQLSDLVASEVLDRHDLATRDGLGAFVPLSSLIPNAPETDADAHTDTTPGADPTLDIREIFVTHNDKRTGPFTLLQVQGLVRSGMLSPHDSAIYRGCLEPVRLETLLQSVNRAVGTTRRLDVGQVEAYGDAFAPTRRMSALNRRRHRKRIRALLAVAAAAVAVTVLVLSGWPADILPYISSTAAAFFRHRLAVRLTATQPHAATLALSLARAASGRQPEEPSGAAEIAPGITRVGGEGRLAVEIALSENHAPGVTATLTPHTIALHAPVVLVNPHNPLHAIGTDALAALLRGAMTEWGELEPSIRGSVTLHLRDTEASVWRSLLQCGIAVDQAALSARFHPSDSAVDRAVAADPHGLGVTGYLPSPRSRILGVHEPGGPPVFPSPFTVRTEDYPLAERVSLLVAADAVRGPAAEVLRFAQTAWGVRIIEEAGMVAPVLTVEYPSLVWRAPPQYRAFVRRAGRVAVSLHFVPGTVELEPKAVSDVARICSVIENAGYEGHRLLLAGFWDPLQTDKETHDASVHAAQAAATAFESHGIVPAAVEGFGAAYKRCSPPSAARPHRNRRVEVWIAPPVSTADEAAHAN